MKSKKVTKNKFFTIQFNKESLLKVLTKVIRQDYFLENPVPSVADSVTMAKHLVDSDEFLSFLSSQIYLDNDSIIDVFYDFPGDVAKFLKDNPEYCNYIKMLKDRKIKEDHKSQEGEIKRAKELLEDKGYSVSYPGKA